MPSLCLVGPDVEAYGVSSGELSLAGYTGTIQKWQTKAGSGSWTDISSTSATHSYSNVTSTTSSGLHFQYQQKNFYLLDINPYVGYRISGRSTGGIGWNHRVAWDSKQKSWNDRSTIFGPRAYVDFKIGKGFIAHLEGESMNSFVPSTFIGNPDAGEREWVWSFMTGLKRQYRIYKNLKGTALIQYNLFNRYYKAPYVDRLNSRIGFEYVLKAKKRRSVQKQ